MRDVKRALVRGIPASFERALAEHAPAAPIDVALAQRQHADYAATLREAGLELTELASDDRYPDCCFVEDRAVVCGDTGIVTWSAAPSRQGEEAAVERALRAALRDVRVMRPPACLDGGDVLRLGHHLFVALTDRTNAAGIAALRETFEPKGYTVHQVAAPPGLHLKCYCSAPRDDLVVVADGLVDPRPFLEAGGVEVVRIPREEAYAANTVGVDEQVLVAEGYPVVASMLRSLGLEVHAVRTSEIAKADGSLTCLSVLLEYSEL